MSKKSEGKVTEKKTESFVDLSKFLKEVELRAYELYQERIGSDKNGDEFSDWLKAESEIKKKYKVEN